MPRTSKINLGELLGAPNYLAKLLSSFAQKENKWYDIKTDTPASGIYELEEKYSNKNPVLKAIFTNGLLKESTYFYPTGEVLCSEKWQDDGLMELSQSFHYSKQTCQIEKYKKGVVVSSEHFNENGVLERDYSYGEGELRNLDDTPNDLSTSLLIKTWLDKGWKE